VVEKYYNFFPIFTGVKILCKFTTIKVVIYSSIPLGKKKPPFVVEINFHYQRWFFSLQPYSLLFSHSTLRGELFPPFWSHSDRSMWQLTTTTHLHGNVIFEAKHNYETRMGWENGLSCSFPQKGMFCKI